MFFVPGAHNNSIQLFGSAVFESAELAFDLRENRLNGKAFRPFEVHRLGPVGAGDVSAPVLVDLRSNIFS